MLELKSNRDPNFEDHSFVQTTNDLVETIGVASFTAKRRAGMSESFCTIPAFILMLTFAMLTAACTREPIDEKVSFTVETKKLSYMSDYQRAVDIKLHNSGKSVILFRVGDHSGDSIRSFPLFYAAKSPDGNEGRLRLKHWYRDEDDAGGMTFKRVVEYEALPPGDFVIRYTLSAQEPVSEIPDIYFDLRIDAYDTGASAAKLDMDDSMFGAAVNASAYRDEEFTFVNITHMHKP